MTTRQYHRSSHLAFPKTAEYASAIERFESRAYSPAWWVCMVVISVVSVAVIVWF